MVWAFAREVFMYQPNYVVEEYGHPNPDDIRLQFKNLCRRGTIEDLSNFFNCYKYCWSQLFDRREIILSTLLTIESNNLNALKFVVEQLPGISTDLEALNTFLTASANNNKRDCLRYLLYKGADPRTLVGTSAYLNFSDVKDLVDNKILALYPSAPGFNQIREESMLREQLNRRVGKMIRQRQEQETQWNRREAALNVFGGPSSLRFQSVRGEPMPMEQVNRVSSRAKKN